MNNFLAKFKRKKQLEKTEFKVINNKGFTEKELKAIAPSSLIETMPNKVANDYSLLIGDNISGVRHLKTWFMDFTGRITTVGLLDPLMLAEGDGAVDITISTSPQEIDIVMSRLATRIAILRSELMTEHNPGKRGDMYQELQDLDGRMGRIRVNAEKMFNVVASMSISADNENKLRKMSRTIIKRMASAGVKFHSADTKQLEAWRYSIGLGNTGLSKNKEKEMESSNAADFFLFGYGGLSHRKGALLGFDHLKRPVFYDGWDPRLLNQHMVVFGQAGGGKSYAVKILTRRSALLGIVTGIIDPDREYKHLIMSMNGSYAELSPKAGNYERINIYDIEEDIDEEGNRFLNIEESAKAVQAVLFKMIRTIDPSALTGQAKVAITKSIPDVYSKAGITTLPESLYHNVDNQFVLKPMPTLSDHYLIMKDIPALQDVAPIIELFTNFGNDSSRAIFDGQSTFSFKKGKVFGICVAGLEEEWMKPIGTFIATKWVWEKFAKKNKLVMKRLIVDEAQLIMENEEEAKWLENAYRRGRKLNVSMCAVTQGFEVFLRVPQGIGILKNAPTKILLRQEKLDIEAVQGKFDLSEGEARFLLSAKSGVGILRVDNESTIINFRATDKEHKLYSTKPSEFLAS